MKGQVSGSAFVVVHGGEPERIECVESQPETARDGKLDPSAEGQPEVQGLDVEVSEKGGS